MNSICLKKQLNLHFRLSLNKNDTSPFDFFKAASDKSSESLHLTILWHSCRYNQVRKTNWRFSPGRSLSVTNLRVQSRPCESWGESASQISRVLQRRSHSEAWEPAWVELLDERLQHLNIYRWATKAIGCCPWRKKNVCLGGKKKGANI